MATRKRTPGVVRGKTRAARSAPPAPAPPEIAPPQIADLAQQAELLRHANEQLDMVREQFADLYEYAPVGFATLDADGVVHRLNLAGAALLGCDRGEALGARFTTFVRPGSRRAFAAFLGGIFSGTGSSTLEVALLHGKWSAEHVQLVAAAASGGRDLGHAGPQARIAIVDVTERKRAEEALRASELRHEAVVSAMAEGVVVHAADGSIVSCNTAAERILGLTADEIMGRTPTHPAWAAIHEDGSPFPGEDHPAQEVLRTGKARWDVLMGLRIPDEGVRWINVRAEPLRGADGKVSGAVATFADVTAARAHEAEIRASREQLALALQGGADGFWDWDVASGRLHLSAGLEALLGGPAVATEDFTSTWPDRVDAAHHDEVAKGIAAVESGERDHVDVEYRVRTAGGAWKWLRARGRVVERGADGRPVRLTGTALDVTAFKEIGERLRRSEALHRVIARSIPNAAVFLADENLRIVLADGPALAAVGLRGADLEGRLASEVVLPDGTRFDGSHFRAAFQGETSRFDLALGERSFAVEVAPVRDEAGRIFLAAASAVDVTRLARAEEELRQRHESLRHRFDLLATRSRDAIFFVRPEDGRILDANAAAEASYGYSREELLGMTVADLRPPEGREAVAGQIAAGIAGHVVFETLQLRKDGSTFTADVSASGAEIDGRKVLVGIVRDVTRRKLAEREAREKAEWLNLALESAEAGTWEWDLRTNDNLWSEGMWRLHGLEPQGRVSTYDVWRSSLHEADRDRTEWAVQNAARMGVDIHLQYRIRARGGAERWIASRGRAVRDEGGRVARYLGVVFDVTDRHRAEEAAKAIERERMARAGEARVRALVENMQDAVVTTDAARRITMWTGAAERMFGYTEAEALGQVPDELLRGEAPLGELEAHLGRLRAGERSRIWLRLHPKEGSPIDADVIVQPLVDGGAISGTLGVIRDITALKEADREVRASEARFHAMADKAPIGVFQTGSRPYMNEAARRILGIGAEEASRGGWAAVLHPEDRERVSREWTEAVAARRAYRTACRIARPDGKVAWVVGHTAPVDDDGNSTHVGMLIDVTEEHALRERLEVASRLGALATLIGGIAHEINNPLAGALANGGFALEALREMRADLEGGRALPPGETLARVAGVVEALEGEQEGALRVAAIVRELVTLSRPEGGRERVSLGEVAEQAIRWLPPGVRDQAEVTLERGDSPEVFGAPGQLEQAVEAMIVNACQSAAPGQRVRVAVRVGTAPGGGARLEVADDGVGMAPDVLARIFDPFFTTRAVGHGKGLGLSVAHSVVAAHGGTLTASSTPGSGTRLCLDIPVVVPQVER